MVRPADAMDEADDDGGNAEGAKFGSHSQVEAMLVTGRLGYQLPPELLRGVVLMGALSYSVAGPACSRSENNPRQTRNPFLDFAPSPP